MKRRSRPTRDSARSAADRGNSVHRRTADRLAWLVNELSRIGTTLRAGEVVTTGVCAVPPAIAAGDRIEADFGALGAARLRLTA